MINYKKLAGYGAKAPSGHNSQPWKFRILHDRIEILPDYSRSLAVVDPTNRELFISLGCATENVVLAAKAQGIQADTEIVPDENKIIVRLTQKIPPNSEWLKLIKNRQSNRGVYTNEQLSEANVKALMSVASEKGISATIIIDDKQRKQIVALINQGNEIQMRDQAFKQELLSWLRFNKREVKDRGDGLAYNAIGNPPLPFRAFGELIAKNFLRPDKQNDHDNRLLESAPALIIFSVEDDNPISWVKLGRYFERMMLTATGLGLAHSHFNQPIEVPSIRKKIKSLGLIKSGHPCLIIRIGHPIKPAAFSPRRRIEEVIIQS